MSKYVVEVSEDARKDIKQLDARTAGQVQKRLKIIATNPEVGKTLCDELAGLRSSRVGDYRVIYDVDTQAGVVDVIAVARREEGSRKNVHEKAAKRR